MGLLYQVTFNIFYNNDFQFPRLWVTYGLSFFAFENTQQKKNKKVFK